MGIDIGPIEVTDGLIFHLDAGNTRSYAGSGLTAYGLVGGIGGTLVNGTGFSSANNGSFFFDGTNDFINCTNSGLALGLGDFTICVWFKSSNKSISNRIFYINTGGPGISLNSSITSGYASFNWGSNGYTGASVDIINGVWNHVTMRRGVSRDSFINGNFHFGNSNPNASIPSSWFLSAYISGNISQFQVYNRALSDSEIKQNYNATKGRYR